MKRIMSTFMICLALINFSACTNAITATPSGGNNGSGNNTDDIIDKEKPFGIVYLTKDYQPTDSKTDTIMLMVDGEETKNF